MASVNGDLKIDFSVLADINPYSEDAIVANRDVNVIIGQLRILGNGLKSNSGLAGFISKESPSATTLESKVTIADFPSGDPLGPALLDAAGNGYWFRCNATETRVRIVNAGVVGSVIGGFLNSAAVGTDDLKLKIDEVTNDITSYLNGVELETVNDATYTGLSAGALYQYDDSRAAAITEWAADGYAVAVSVGPPDPLTDGATAQAYTPTGFDSGNVNSITLDGIAVPAFTQTTFDNFNIPAIANDAGTLGSKLGSVVFEATNGTETANDTIVNQSQANYTYVTLTTVDTGANTLYGLMLAQLGHTIVTGDQFNWPNADGSTVSNDSNYSFASLPKTFQWYELSSGKWYELTMTTGGVISGGTGNSKISLSIGIGIGI